MYTIIIMAPFFQIKLANKQLTYKQIKTRIDKMYASACFSAFINIKCTSTVYGNVNKIEHIRRFHNMYAILHPIY